jgi:signal peptidase I
MRPLLRFLGRTALVLSLAVATLTVCGLALANALEQQLMIVASGSMSPEFAAGDAVLVRPVDEPAMQPGVVVVFRSPGNLEHLTTHRIVSRHARPEGLFLQTQGDANPAPDPDFVSAGSVVGAMTRPVPRLGFWLSFYQSDSGRLLVLGMPLLLLGLAQALELARGLRRRDPHHLGGGVTLVATVTVLGISVATGVLLALTTSARYTDAVPLPVNSFTTNATYCGTGVAYHHAVTSDSPTIYHRFSQTSGTNAANSGTGTPGRYTGGYTLGQPGAIACQSGAAARAVRLDGATGQVVRKNNAATTGPNTFTLEAWFRTTVGGGKLIGFGNERITSSTSYDRHLFLTDGGAVVFGVRPDTVREVVSPDTYSDGQWHHVVATLGAVSPTDGMRLYVDGTLVASRTDTTTAQAYNGYWRIGFDNLASWTSAPSNPYFTGDLDEVAIYPATLTAARVAAHYDARRR